ncbi:MAG: lipopolysaccharide assembly protein LapA domain-containing protein [Sphingomicrobium sp.]
MQFLKTLFWMAVAVIISLFAWVNWNPVTLNLWGDLQADIKIPVLLLLVFILGFLPTFLILRGRLWSARRRYEALERSIAPPVTAEPRASTDTEVEAGL